MIWHQRALEALTFCCQFYSIFDFYKNRSPYIFVVNSLISPFSQQHTLPPFLHSHLSIISLESLNCVCLQSRKKKNCMSLSNPKHIVCEGNMKYIYRPKYSQSNVQNGSSKVIARTRILFFTQVIVSINQQEFPESYK